MKFEQSPSKPSVDTQEYTRALLDQLSEQNNLWKLTLGYLAEKEVGNPLVIPSILTENRAYSAPQASIVAIRVVTNQTSGVSITANGSIYIPVGLSYTQVPTGQLNQISVGGLNDGNKVWVQYLDERAAAMSAAGDGNVVQLTGSLAPLTAVGPTSVSLPASDFNTTALVVSGQYGVFHRNARTRYVIVSNNLSVSITVYLVPFDDLGTASVPSGLTQDASNTYTVAAGNAAQFAYNSVPTMNAPLNSFYLGITPAATGATGTIDVAWIENI